MNSNGATCSNVFSICHAAGMHSKGFFVQIYNPVSGRVPLGYRCCEGRSFVCKNTISRSAVGRYSPFL